MNLEKFYDKATTWLVDHGPKLFLAIFVFIIGQWLLRILKKIVRGHMSRKQLDSSLQPFLISLLFTILQVLLALTAMQIIGIQMTIFAALIGGIGVAAGLALSGSPCEQVSRRSMQTASTSPLTFGSSPTASSILKWTSR